VHYASRFPHGDAQCAGCTRCASRFGVGLAPAYPGIASFPSRLRDFEDIATLGFGWYSNWAAGVTPERRGGVQYVQLLNTRSWPPNWQAIDHWPSDANRGALWIIGNEPEIPSQGNNTPNEYATIYHEAYTHIKALDPLAQIAIGGVVMPSPLRLLWLDETLAAYQKLYGTKMPVDVWNIHVQILPEDLNYGCFKPHGLSLPEAKQKALALNHGDTGSNMYFAYNADPAIFQQLVRAMRTWMAERGERDKPLIISEYGVLYPSTFIGNHVQEGQQEAGDQMVIAFMQETFDFLLTARDAATGYPADDNRLVQQWLWFSVNVPLSEFNGSLYDYETRQMTVFGRAYRDYVAAPGRDAGLTPSGWDAVGVAGRMSATVPSGPVERLPLPPSGLPDLTLRPPYAGQ
jgi:hypothetical protein